VPSHENSCISDVHIQRALAKMTTIYFDLDGTLTDPKLGITRSIRYALGKLNRRPPPEDELTWCIGPPLRASLKKLLGTDDLAGKALSLYRERFADIGIFENEIYPGIEDTLSVLAKSGRRLFVATSKPSAYAERIIDHFKLKVILNACLVPNWMAGVPTRPTFWVTPVRRCVLTHCRQL
jgi:phosphoglycolate phosphatase-like HAD superfamily hydrolase